MATTLFTQSIIACIWDFDKTLIPGYMQGPLFRRYGIDEATFWAETNKLVENYAKRGYRISSEISYLNHILTYVRAGLMPKLNNKVLHELGAEIQFYQGLPEFFVKSRGFVTENPDYRKHELQLEHYIVSTGIAEMIRGSAIAPYVDGIWGCEFIENPLQPGTHRFPVIGAIGISEDVEAVAIMHLQRLDQQQGRGMIMEIIGKIADPDPVALAAIEAEGKPGAFLSGIRQPVPDPKLGTGALLAPAHAGLAEKLEGRQRAGIALGQDPAHMRDGLGETVPFAHAPPPADGFHEAGHNRDRSITERVITATNQ